MVITRRLRRARTGLAAAIAVAACALPAALAQAAAGPGFLHRDGTRIVDGDGTPVTLRGVNLGNWLLWEQWMMGARGPSNAGQTRMVDALGSLVGPARAQRFVADVITTATTRADVERIAGLGFDVVRVPINHTALEGDAAPAGWKALDDVVGWARRAGIRVVLDMHAAPGGQSPYFIADPDGDGTLWTRPVNRLRTIGLWRAIAARYRDEPAVAGYDLLNEPFAPSAEALTAFYGQLADAIRAVDPNHLLLVEGATFARDTSALTARVDENSAISIHQYLWGTPTPELDLLAALADGRRLDLPVWIGEMGNDDLAGIAAQVRRFDGDPAFSGWAAWSWTAADQANGHRSLNGFTPTPAWQKTVDWLAVPTRPRPTAAEAEQGMADYLRLVADPRPDPAVIAAYRPWDGPGTGLAATYFADAQLRRPVLHRTDAAIDFDWRLGAPAGGLPADRFSVRWTGTVEPVATGPTRFTATVDDSVRVWVDGRLVIDDWAGGARHSVSGVADLAAGRRTPIVVEYADRSWNASIRLAWRPPGTMSSVVPTASLRP